MRIGIVDYKIAYSGKMKKVCISTTDIRPAGIHCYTRHQIMYLIASTHGIMKSLYEMALGYFPAGNGS